MQACKGCLGPTHVTPGSACLCCTNQLKTSLQPPVTFAGTGWDVWLEHMLLCLAFCPRRGLDEGGCTKPRSRHEKVSFMHQSTSCNVRITSSSLISHFLRISRSANTEVQCKKFLKQAILV